jgi:hypothetical protein
MIKQKLATTITGHVRVVDKNTSEVLLDDFNAVHPQNMARVFSRALANEPNAQIFKIALGNGGTNIQPDFTIQYLPPNIVGVNSTLYNETYSEIVDDGDSGLGVGNSVVSSAAESPSIASIVTVTCEIASDEPAGQALSEGEETNPEAPFMFDELGLFSADSPDALMLSHIIFSPIEKNATRSLLITYTLTISVDNEP